LSKAKLKAAVAWALAWAKYLARGAWLFLDCLVNVLLLGSYKETLSSRAGRAREKRRPFGITANRIDGLFLFFFSQLDHCRRAMNHEAHNGGVWVSWRSARPKRLTINPEG
jgi:hypothetical protein